MLKLAALDADDLAVVSAQMQDAVLQVGGMSYSRQRRQFALIANRYAWDAGRRERRRTGLHFDRVTAVKSLHIRHAEPDAVVSLLAITFTPGDEPSGTVELVFSGGGLIRLSVECIEASLQDLGQSWETTHQPQHSEADDRQA